MYGEISINANFAGYCQRFFYHVGCGHRSVVEQCSCSTQSVRSARTDGNDFVVRFDNVAIATQQKGFRSSILEQNHRQRLSCDYASYD